MHLQGARSAPVAQRPDGVAVSRPDRDCKACGYPSQGDRLAERTSERDRLRSELERAELALSEACAKLKGTSQALRDVDDMLVETRKASFNRGLECDHLRIENAEHGASLKRAEDAIAKLRSERDAARDRSGMSDQALRKAVLGRDKAEHELAESLHALHGKTGDVGMPPANIGEALARALERVDKLNDARSLLVLQRDQAEQDLDRRVHAQRAGIDAEIETAMISTLSDLGDVLGTKSMAEMPGKARELRAFAVRMEKERDEFDREINSPQTANFLSAVTAEVAHQIERWGTEHDAGKRNEDWVALIVYLLGKATKNHWDAADICSRDDDCEEFLEKRDKHRHHVITIAAACANWHAALIGANNRPIHGPGHGGGMGGHDAD